MTGMIVMPVPRQRRHTLFFLREIRPIAPVFLDTDVDMTAVSRHRRAARDGGDRYSVASYVLCTAARALIAHPEANAAIHGRLRPRLARYQTVNGKLTLDRTIDGQRVVLSAVLPDLHRATLAEVQEQVDRYRDGDPDQMPEFAGVRMLHRLPWLLGGALFRLGVRPLHRRAEAFGTFAVSSLGHRPVDGFYSVGGTTITLGLGQVADRPVARDGRLEIAPTMRLSLAFDHRVVDGALAADVLADIRGRLESFPAAAGLSRPVAFGSRDTLLDGDAAA
jgi:pyruvate/2-oxoglutarate dehydrogenase complex dihydrolipoamide acyltransferase (E2) component